tara:strand:+ start:85 stop:567 length:483 start_codon:yes stop_codon:yes gene_type:complete
MIIICPCKKKSFEIDAALIPDKGRTLKCGSCDHVWFYNPKKIESTIINKTKKINTIEASEENNHKNIKSKKKYEKKEVLKSKEQINEKNYELTKYKKKSNFSFNKLLSYIIVALVSFVALIIILDTFKSVLYQLFPNLELALFSLFELLKDIRLFIKDLF